MKAFIESGPNKRCLFIYLSDFPDLISSDYEYQNGVDTTPSQNMSLFPAGVLDWRSPYPRFAACIGRNPLFWYFQGVFFSRLWTFWGSLLTVFKKNRVVWFEWQRDFLVPLSIFRDWENGCEQVTIGCAFAYDWLRMCHDISQLITQHRNTKPKQSRTCLLARNWKPLYNVLQGVLTLKVKISLDEF